MENKIVVRFIAGLVAAGTLSFALVADAAGRAPVEPIRVGNQLLHRAGTKLGPASPRRHVAEPMRIGDRLYTRGAPSAPSGVGTVASSGTAPRAVQQLIFRRVARSVAHLRKQMKDGLMDGHTIELRPTTRPGVVGYKVIDTTKPSPRWVRSEGELKLVGNNGRPRILGFKTLSF